MIYRIFGKRAGRITTGIVGLLAGFIFLFLNLSDPASATGSDWTWCVIGFVLGVGFLALGIFSPQRSV